MRACMGGGMFVCHPALVKSSHGLRCSSPLCQRVPYHFRWQWKTGMTKHHRCCRFSFSLRAQTQRVRHRHRQKKKKHPPTHLSILFTSHCECSLGNARAGAWHRKSLDEPLYIYGWWGCILSAASLARIRGSGKGGAMWGEFKINEATWII